MSAPPILWQPSQESIENANLTRFARESIRRWKLKFNTYPEFYRWSVEHPEQFWVSVWDALGAIGERGSRALVDGHRMPGAKWFPDAHFNFAENLLKRSDAGDAMVFWDETGPRGRMNWKQLLAMVSSAQQAMRAAGVKPGDRVAAFIPNMPETCVLSPAAIRSARCGPLLAGFRQLGVLIASGRSSRSCCFARTATCTTTGAMIRRGARDCARLPCVERVVVPNLSPCRRSGDRGRRAPGRLIAPHAPRA